MSKQAAAPAPAPAPAPPPAYGKAAMVDLVDEIDWSACEVLNATGSLQNVLKQGLRDQEGMLLESDADEQATALPTLTLTLILSLSLTVTVTLTLTLAVPNPAVAQNPLQLCSRRGSSSSR